MNNKFPLLLALLCHLSILTREYVYPVMKTPIQESIILVHQEDQVISLLNWDPITQIAYPLVSSTSQPADIQLIPQTSLVSFADHGRIKYLNIINNSLSALSFNKPLCDIGVHSWATENVCCFSALERGNRNIYFFNTCTNELTTVLADQVHDFLYPQCVGNSLFTITSTLPKGYKSSRPYYSVMRYDLTQKNISGEMIFDAGKEDFLAFLHMKNEYEGFFVGYSSSLSNQDIVTTFDYYHMINKHDKWQVSMLFSFEIPVFLLSGFDRLHESLMPLLPKHFFDKIYYVRNTGEENCPTLNVFCFDQANSLASQKTFAKNSGKMVFSPIYYKNIFFYGGEVEKGSAGLLPTVEKLENNVKKIRMPYFN